MDEICALTGMYLSNSFGPAARRRVASGEYAGWLVSPQTRGIPAGVKRGDRWAGDNGCFSASFTDAGFIAWLRTMQPYRDSCLFVVAPDVLGDWAATAALWAKWESIIKAPGFYPAYVGQDNQPIDLLPWGRMSVYFVGGTDAWKNSAASLEIVRECRRRAVRVHLGRGNTNPRLQAFLNAYRLDIDPAGSPFPYFTFDGNGIRMAGKAAELSDTVAQLHTRRMI